MSENLKRDLAAFFEKRQEINSAYLFGSLTAGSSTPISDTDIAVSVDKDSLKEGNYPYGYAAHLTSCLMHLLRTNRVDVLLLEDAPPVLKHRVFTQGVLVFCRNPLEERGAFVRAFRQYQDTAPLRRIQQFYLDRYLKNLGAPSGRG